MSEMLNSIKNAAMARKSSTEAFYSKECEAVAKVLKDRGFLAEVKVFKEGQFKRLNLTLAYQDKMPMVTEVKRVSKPGHRIYQGYDSLHKIQAGFGVAVVSTSRGIMASEEAKKKKLGGELICKVY